MLEKSTRIAGIVFSVFWMLFILLEYWQYHADSRRAIAIFQFQELGLALLIIGIVFVFCFTRFRKWKIFRRLSNGLGILLFSLFLLLICVNGFFYKNLGQFLSLEENLFFLTSILGIAGATYIILLTAYGVGHFICKLFSLDFSQKVLHLTAMGLGILVIVALLFLLGALKLLSGWVLWPVFGLLIALSWRSVWQFLQLTLWKPIPATEKINALGLGVFYILLLFISMNFAQVARPFPIGFDAITYYVNLSSLISEYKSLVQGFGAYNWSLFMSLGYLLFNQTAITLSLSFSGGILALLVLFQLSRRWLDVNYSLLVLLLFYTLPMISWLSYRDMKVDMGLLFYALLILLLAVDWLVPSKKIKKKKVSNSKSQRNARSASMPKGKIYLENARQWISDRQPAVLNGHAYLILIGILIGFSVGIKFSALIILLSFLPAIAYARGNRIAFAGSLCIMLFLVLFARFDAQAALRPLHLWANQLQWLLGLTGLGLVIYLFLRQREVFSSVFKSTLICIIFCALTLSPWLIKNAIETRSISITSLTNGEPANPRPSIQDIQKAYEDARINR
ncbi:MAG: hypothetical protein R2824_06250 [Saprospiraceae bacterium]